MKENKLVIPIGDIAKGKEFKLKVKEFEITVKLFDIGKDRDATRIIEQAKDAGFREMTLAEKENFVDDTREVETNLTIESACAYSIENGEYRKHYLCVYGFTRRIALSFNTLYLNECLSFLGVKS